MLPRQPSRSLGVGHGARKIAGVLVDTGEIDRVFAVGDLLAPVALPQHALLGHVAGVEREIVARIEREIVGDLGEGAELLGVAVLGHQEAAFALHRRIGMLEVGHVEDRLAEYLEVRILVGDRRGRLIVDDLGSADAPQRRNAVLALTGRERALRELGNVTLAALGTLGRNARVIAGDDRQRLHEAVAEIVGQRVAVGADDVAVDVLELDVARGGERVGALVVDDLVGRQDVVVIEDFDVAAGQ